MKKISFRLLFAIMLGLFTTVGFTSCGGSDDDGDGPSNGAIVGTWESTRISGWEKEDGEKDTFDEPYDEDRITFNDDNTFIRYYRSGSSWRVEDYGTYSLSGSKLTIRYEDGDVVQVNITINGNTAKIRDKGKEVDEDGVYEWDVTITYKRVND